MGGPPHSVWVEVSTELLAELGDWSEPVQVRIHDLRPNGQVEMELRRPVGDEGWRVCTCIDVRVVHDSDPVLIPGENPCPIHR